MLDRPLDVRSVARRGFLAGWLRAVVSVPVEVECGLFVGQMPLCYGSRNHKPRLRHRPPLVGKIRGGHVTKRSGGCAHHRTGSDHVHWRCLIASRRSGSGSDYDQWTLSVKSEIHTPSPTKHRPTKRPPNLTNLGRASDETVVLHMAKYRSRTLRVTANRLSNVQGQT